MFNGKVLLHIMRNHDRIEGTHYFFNPRPYKRWNFHHSPKLSSCFLQFCPPDHFFPAFDLPPPKKNLKLQYSDNSDSKTSQRHAFQISVFVPRSTVCVSNQPTPRPLPEEVSLPWILAFEWKASVSPNLASFSDGDDFFHQNLPVITNDLLNIMIFGALGWNKCLRWRPVFVEWKLKGRAVEIHANLI